MDFGCANSFEITVFSRILKTSGAAGGLTRRNAERN